MHEALLLPGVSPQLLATTSHRIGRAEASIGCLVPSPWRVLCDELMSPHLGHPRARFLSRGLASADRGNASRQDSEDSITSSYCESS